MAVTTLEPKADRAEVLPEMPEGELESPQQVPREVFNIPRSLFTKKIQEDIIKFISSELDEAEIERVDFIRKLARWKVAYKAPRAEKPKNFPIHNASNIRASVIKEAVNTLVAQLVQTTMTASPVWIMKDLSAQWEPFKDPLERFMDLAADRDMNLDDAMIDAITEMTKLGTSILSLEWDVDERRIYQYTSDGAHIYPRTVVNRDGPLLTHIPLEKWWIRFTEKDIQKARWCATELDFTEQELVAKANQGKFHSISEIIKAEGDDTLIEPVTSGQENIEKTIPIGSRRRFKVFRIYLSYDIDNDGNFEELLIYYHRDSATIIGDFFTPHWHGKKPYIKMRYFPVEDRFYGEGICEMLESMQEAISSWINRRGDNATLANLKMFIKRKLSRGINPGDPLYPGKVIEVTDIHNDLREFQMSEIYPSTVNEEQLLQGRANRISGISEANLGSASPVSRTTAAAQLALLQEQAKRVDLTVREIRKARNKIGSQALHLYFQYGSLGKGLAWMGESGRKVDALFRLPRLANELGFAIKAQTPTSLSNKQVERENKLQIFQLLVQAHQQILPLAQGLVPDAIPEIARGLISGTIRFLTDTLETFGESDPESILASLTVLEKLLPARGDFGGLESFQRASETDILLNQLDGLETLLREAKSSRDEFSRTRPNGDTRNVSAPSGLLPGNSGVFGPGGESAFRSPRGSGAL